MKTYDAKTCWLEHKAESMLFEEDFEARGNKLVEPEHGDQKHVFAWQLRRTEIVRFCFYFTASSTS